MTRRVHELAREWNLTTKDLTAGLDRIGVRGKKSQSSLTDDEVERLAIEVGRAPRPNVNVGGERLVDVSGQTLVERRVGTNVIRRRSTVVQPVEETPLATPIESFGAPMVDLGESMPLESLESSEPAFLPTAAEVSELGLPSEPEPAIEALAESSAAEPPVTREAPPVAPPLKAKPVAAPSAAPAPVAAPAADRPSGPRVLGRIDLKKVEAERAAAIERSARADQGPGRRGPAAAAVVPAELPADPNRVGRKPKKRRVIQKPEFAEVSDREARAGRLPRKRKAAPGKEQKKTEITTPKASKRVLRIGDAVVVGDVARQMGIKAAEVVKKLMELGMMATINQVIDAETAGIVAQEFGYAVEQDTANPEQEIEREHEVTGDEEMVKRPPVITIMGHVDHGKTSLLDAIRETNVTSEEAGGITQHIGAYSVDVHGSKVTFLDTPGHEAFTAMRARGAKVTDVVVLVVAADDGVMPQTIEAINHARAASVPIVVAINKIDKPEANLERIRQNLADHGLVPEEWGGDTVCVPVSAKTREGLPQLLELLLLQSDVLELKANPNKAARGTIVEAKLDRGRGPVATVLVQEGTLKIGDAFICGVNYGRIRAMINDRGQKVKEADPSMPVEILGLTAVPEAGSPFAVVAEEATARQIAEHRRAKHREATLIKTSKVSLDDLYRQIQAGDTKELRVVIKADVQGSVEALSGALSRLSTDEVRLNVLHASVGGITESDIMLASASNAVVIGFNVRPEAKASEAAEREGVDVRLYTIIYEAENELRDAMEGLLEPTYREKVTGRAEVRQVFAIPGIGTIAGCSVSDGSIKRNGLARLLRDHVVVYQGKITSLRRFKEDAREVTSGYECGIGLESYQDLKVGDIIEAYELEQVARRLSSGSGQSRGVAAERAY